MTITEPDQTTTEPGTDTDLPAALDVTVHLKGGTSFTVRLAEWRMGRSRLTDDLVSLSWETLAGHPRLRYLDIGSVAAVLVADVPAEPTADGEQ